MVDGEGRTLSSECGRARYRPLIEVATLLATAIVLPRVFAGTLLVRYDILFIGSHGEGYAPALVSLGMKMVSLATFVAALVAIVRQRSEKLLWLSVGILSALSFLSIGMPTDSDFARAIDRGHKLAQQIEAYHRAHGRYPDRLKELPNAPKTGLAKGRRFYYASAQSKFDDSGDWFTSARAYLGRAPYVICVPLVPGGTDVYRPTREYSDLRGHAIAHGWFHTTRD